MADQPGDLGAQLNSLLAAVNLPILQDEQSKAFITYLSLVLRWNARTNLTAVRDQGDILARHFVECIAVARTLPSGIATLLDFGSGAGFPGIPIALIRPEIAVTLAESQGKKAAFLQEAVRRLGLSAKVHNDRAETLTTQFDCVTLRSVDRMERAVAAAGPLVKPGGWIALMTTSSDSPILESVAGAAFHWTTPTPLPSSESRILALANRL